MNDLTSPLPEPVNVGSVTAMDMAEIRSRRDVRDRLAARIEKARADIETDEQLARIAEFETTAFVNRVIASQGLDLRHQYRVDDRTGAITMTAAHHEHHEQDAPVEIPDYPENGTVAMPVGEEGG